MYSELIVRLTDVARNRFVGPLAAYRGDDVRACLAKLADAAGSPRSLEALFHYENGRPAHGQSPIRFQSTKSGFAIIGIGARGRALIHEHAPSIQGLLVSQLKTLVPVQLKDGQNGLQILPYDRPYHASRVILSSNKEGLRWQSWYSEALARNADLLSIPEARALAEKSLTRSLLRQLTDLHDTEGDFTLDRAGATAPSGDEYDDRDLARLTVSIASHAGAFPLRRAGLEQSRYTAAQSKKMPVAIGLKQPVFNINAKLTGRFALGYLLSRGYGQLWAHAVADQATAAA